MMQIVYFSDKDRLLAHIQGLAAEKIFITPSPQKADSLRGRLGSHDTQDVITVSKFTGELLKSLWPDENQRPVMKRKSELLLVFGVLKNRLIPDLGYEQFMQAYNLFSDLRSFSLDINALSGVLDEQPEEVRRAMQMFWMVMRELNVLDEHGAYQAISEELRTAEEKEGLKKTFVFWGFQHLNGQQVDLLRALAIRYNVVIPFPLTLKVQLKHSDWVSWVREHNVEEVELLSELKSPRAKWLMVNSREMSRHLGDIGKDTQVILGVSKLTPSHLDLVPFNDVSFKVNQEILKNEIAEVSHELQVDAPGDLPRWLEEKFNESVKEHNYKKLRVVQLYQEALASISVLSDQSPQCDAFFQKLLKEVVILNQPRSAYVPMAMENSTIQLRDLSMLEDIDLNKETVFCVDDRFDDFQGLGQQYSEPVLKALLSLGPVKRNELELLFKQFELRELFSKANVTVMMPASVLDHSLVWKKAFDGIELEQFTEAKEVEARKPRDYFESRPKKTFNEHFSASKFQSYYDCPRKFYYNSVERIFPNVVLESDIDNKVSGTLVHKIIEFYFERGAVAESIPSIAKEVLDGEITRSKLVLPTVIYADRLVTFRHRAINGVRMLQELERVSGQKIKWKIEQGFDHQDTYHIKGSIDCIGESDTHVWLLDFKSTKTSASTNTDVNAIDSLQLWVYTLAAEKIVHGFETKSLIHGYITLDEPKKSNIFFEDPDLLDAIKKADFCSPTTWDEERKVMVDQARTKLEALALTIKADTKFTTTPRTEKACQYCELAAVCTKGEVTHGS